MCVGRSNAKSAPTMMKTNSVPKATPYTEINSTDSSILLAICSENNETIAGKIVFTDNTIRANVPAINGLITNER